MAEDRVPRSVKVELEKAIGQYCGNLWVRHTDILGITAPSELPCRCGSPDLRRIPCQGIPGDAPILWRWKTLPGSCSHPVGDRTIRPDCKGRTFEGIPGRELNRLSTEYARFRDESISLKAGSGEDPGCG